MALSERPSLELKGERTWHIGNMYSMGVNQGYFAFGRTTRTTNSKYDDVSGNFVEEEFETSPYTHVVYDSSVGFVGIAHNHRLARSATGIAAKLEQVLRFTTIVRESGVDVIVAAISDPESFLNTIAKSYRVLQFTAHFTGPNPFDADEFFQRPLSVYASAANAKKGKAQIDGDNLDREVVAEVARSTAATGNKAKARVKRRKNQPAVTIGLKGDPVKRRFAEESHDPNQVVEELSAAYKEVRDDD